MDGLQPIGTALAVGHVQPHQPSGVQILLDHRQGHVAPAAGIDRILLPAVRDIGDGFQVRRFLPSAMRRSVGPFIFLDSFGPVTSTVGEGNLSF
ncbi:hypothetical protein HUE56_28230 (plasmid) [Azospirillum oryzae]|uniref:Uncharacterized protein n=1 Tax=Azospirillum oryzae TaxID=286727 RepID=A0A6N1AQ30_9PROT|nr:hypothetical protein [Azospirillum oryzae]QKS53650.1 hypothetical protein HUE56_28230 [Azospirillum oryzae]